MSVIEDIDIIRKAENNMNIHKNMTTTQIRKILSISAKLYDESFVIEFEKLKPKIDNLRIQFIYQSSRKQEVKNFYKDQNLRIDDCLKSIDNNENLRKFCKYMEALVAFHRYYGGKDS